MMSKKREPGLPLSRRIVEWFRSRGRLTQLALSLVLLLASIHVFVAIVFSLPPVQRRLIDEAKGFLAREFHINADVESVSVTIFPLALELNGVSASVSDLEAFVGENPDVNVDEALRLALGRTTIFVSHFELHVRTLALLGLVNPVRLSSWFSLVSFEGVRVLTPDASFLEALLAQKGSTEPREDDDPLFSRYLGIFDFLPKKFVVNDLQVEAGSPSELTYAALGCESITFLKGRFDDAAVIIRCGDSALKSPKFPRTLAVLELRAEARIKGDGQILADKIRAEVDGLAFDASGQVRLPVRLGEEFAGKFRVTADGEFRLLDLVGVPASGTVRVDADLNLVPFSALGRVAWENSKMRGFALYSGDAKFQLDTAEAHVTELAIRTPMGGEIDGAGWLEFSDALAFRAVAEVRKWPFRELLRGFGPDTDVIDFNLDAPRLEVSGRGTAPHDKVFDLLILGPARASGIGVPLVAGKGAPGSHLSDCDIQLRLAIDANELDFDRSLMSCFATQGHEMHVSKGRVNLDEGGVSFDVSAKKFDLAAVNYFADVGVEGVADFVGSIATNKSTGGVFFEASVGADQFSLLGARLDEIQTKLRIDDAGLTLTETKSAALGVTLPALESDRVFVSFADRPSQFRLRAEGPLRALRRVFPSIKVFEQFSGQISYLDLDVGLKMSPFELVWLRGSAKMHDLDLPGLSASGLNAKFDCTGGVKGCESSRVQLSGLAVGWEKQSGGIDRAGVVHVSVAALSSAWVDLGIEMQNIPLNVREDSDLSAVLASSVSLKGTMAEPEVSGKLGLYEVLYLGQAIGDVELILAKSGDSALEGTFSAAYQQLFGRFIIPFSASEESTLYATAQTLDFMFLFPTARKAQNLYSEISGSLEFRGPSPFSLAWKSGDWVKHLFARVVMQKGVVSAQGLRLWNTEPVTMLLNDGGADISEMELVSKGSRFSAHAEMDLLSRRLKARVDGVADLGLLKIFLPGVASSVGQAQFDLDLEVEPAKPPSFRGLIDVSLKEMLITDFEPAFENVRARVNLVQDRFEIASLSGTKGSGSFEALGSAVMASDESGSVPELGMRLRMKKLQTRLPAPIFRGVDAILSGNLELKGARLPYQLSGSVVIDRGRLYRDLNCEEIVAEAPVGEGRRIESDSISVVDLDITLESNESVSLQTRCIRSKLSSKLRIQGSESNPQFGGSIWATEGRALVLKSKFDIQRTEVIFDTPLSFDPRLDIQMVAQIDGYQVFMNIDGYSRSPRTSFWSEPSVTPSGQPIGRAEIIRMIASGRGPRDGAEGNLIANQVATYVYGSTELDDSLSRAFAKFTAGLFDTVQLEPVIESGQTSWKARISRSLGDRFNLGLDVEQSSLVNNQSLTGTLYLNDTVNVLGGFDRSVTELETYFEFSGGLRFRFGSN